MHRFRSFLAALHTEPYGYLWGGCRRDFSCEGVIRPGNAGTGGPLRDTARPFARRGRRRSSVRSHARSSGRSRSGAAVLVFPDFGGQISAEHGPGHRRDADRCRARQAQHRRFRGTRPPDSGLRHPVTGHPRIRRHPLRGLRRSNPSATGKGPVRDPRWAGSTGVDRPQAAPAFTGRGVGAGARIVPVKNRILI